MEKNKRFDKFETRVLIIGAGIAGKKLLKDILDNKKLHIKPMGFIDDDPKKISKIIFDVSVLGNISQLEHYIKLLNIEKVLIALPSADGTVVSTIFKRC